RCAELCPTGALTVSDGRAAIDLGRCIFCTECVAGEAAGAVAFTRDWRLASSPRDGLIVTDTARPQVDALDRKLRRPPGRPLLPVALYVPGCPPHPVTILDGLLRLLGRT